MRRGLQPRLAREMRPTSGGFSAATFGSAYFLLGVLVFLFLVFCFLRPDTFPTAFNLQTMGTSKSIVALLALAVMVPIAANEFDLSVGYARRPVSHPYDGLPGIHGRAVVHRCAHGGGAGRVARA